MASRRPRIKGVVKLATQARPTLEQTITAAHNTGETVSTSKAATNVVSVTDFIVEPNPSIQSGPFCGTAPDQAIILTPSEPDTLQSSNNVTAIINHCVNADVTKKTTQLVRLSKKQRPIPKLGNLVRKPRIDTEPEQSSNNAEKVPLKEIITTDANPASPTKKFRTKTKAIPNVVNQIVENKEEHAFYSVPTTSSAKDPSELELSFVNHSMRKKVNREHTGFKDTMKKINAGDVQRDKLVMRDFIYYDPGNNPLVTERDADDPDDPPALEISSTPEENNVDDPLADVDQKEEIAAPQIKISSDGSIEIDTASLTVQSAEQKKATAIAKGEALFEPTLLKPYVSKAKKNINRKDWTTMETLLFYKCLKEMGTDFSLMENMFPNRSRSQLKEKYKREEKINGKLIEKAISTNHNFDINELKSFRQYYEEEAAARKATKKTRKPKSTVNKRKEPVKQKGQSTLAALLAQAQKDSDDENAELNIVYGPRGPTKSGRQPKARKVLPCEIDDEEDRPKRVVTKRRVIGPEQCGITKKVKPRKQVRIDVKVVPRAPTSSSTSIINYILGPEQLSQDLQIGCLDQDLHSEGSQVVENNLTIPANQTMPYFSEDQLTSLPEADDSGALDLSTRKRTISDSDMFSVDLSSDIQTLNANIGNLSQFYNSVQPQQTVPETRATDVEVSFSNTSCSTNSLIHSDTSVHTVTPISKVYEETVAAVAKVTTVPEQKSVSASVFGEKLTLYSVSSKAQKDDERAENESKMAHQQGSRQQSKEVTHVAYQRAQEVTQPQNRSYQQSQNLAPYEQPRELMHQQQCSYQQSKEQTTAPNPQVSYQQREQLTLHQQSTQQIESSKIPAVSYQSQSKHLVVQQMPSYKIAGTTENPAYKLPNVQEHVAQQPVVLYGQTAGTVFQSDLRNNKRDDVLLASGTANTSSNPSQNYKLTQQRSEGTQCDFEDDDIFV